MRQRMITSPKWTLVYLLIAHFAASVLPGLGEGVDYWEWRNPLPQGNPLVGAAYGNNTYVVVGDGHTVLTSPDGVTWTPHKLGAGIQWLDAIAFGMGKFVAVGSGIWTSIDGTNWVQRSEKHLALGTVIFADGKFVAAGILGTIVVSTDGVEWTNTIAATAEFLNGLCFAHGLYVAVGGWLDRGVILTSTDGLGWTNVLSGSDVLFAPAYGNGQFVVAGQHFYGGTNVILTSPDGVTWERKIIEAAIDPAGLCFSHGLFIVAGTHGLFTSTDALRWTNRYTGDGNSLYNVVAVNGSLVAVGNSGAIVTSPDGINWTRRTAGTTMGIKGIAYGNGRFVAVGNWDTLLTSTNGVNWVDLTGAIGDSLTDVAFGGGRFVATGVSPSWSSTIYTSLDGLVWSNVVDVTDYLYSASFHAGTFVLTGFNVHDGDGTILTSTNGLNWQDRSVEETNGIYASAYGAGSFVAVGSQGTVLSSSDGGGTWTRRVSGTTNSLVAIAYGNGVFVTGDHYGYVCTSTNGIFWNGRQHSFGEAHLSLRGITYGNGLFLALDSIGLLTSTNGVDWVRRPCPTIQSLNQAIYAQNTFVVVGEWGVILQSAYAAAPNFSNPERSAAGFGFSVAGEPGRRYRIQGSSSLEANSWTDLLDYTNSNTRFWFNAPSNLPRQFFRVIAY